MGITVLSLFDGMSCGQIALRELGIEVDRYYASEIDRFCIEQTALNFPDTVQLGDVRTVNVSDLPKIDLILAGSPCQGFSYAGKQLNFTDPRSALFFEFVRILRHAQALNPEVIFLLENVQMKHKYAQTISDILGLSPVKINSALVSAQNRTRLYWSNIRTRQTNLFDNHITDIPQPQDRGLFLSDILEDDVEERYNVKDNVLQNLISHKEKNKEKGRGFGMVVKMPDEKSTAVRIGGKGMYDIVCVAMRGRYDQTDGRNKRQLEARQDGKTNTVTTVQKDNFILQRPRGRNAGATFSDKTPTLTANAWEQNNLVCSRSVKQINPSAESNGRQPYQQNRVYSADGISPALCSSRRGQSPLVITPGDVLRRMTPTECARLQTIPEWYKWGCSATQQYKMLGNGWTVEVIKHILSFLPDNLKIQCAI